MSEELSAVTALLEDKVFLRDLALVTMRHPGFSQYESLMLTLTIHNHVLLNSMWSDDEKEEEKDDDPPPPWLPPPEGEWR